MERRCLGVVLAVAILGSAAGFYLPGVAPVDFAVADLVDVKVNKLTSVHTQLPLDYYSMPFCE